MNKLIFITHRKETQEVKTAKEIVKNLVTYKAIEKNIPSV
jgi:hypothetical protein